jgi:hypothetical protein
MRQRAKIEKVKEERDVDQVSETVIHDRGTRGLGSDTISDREK